MSDQNDNRIEPMKAGVMFRLSVKHDSDPRRQAVRNALSSLETGLGEFEQTTHGCLFLDGPPSIESVCRKLVAAYNNPTSFEISDLSQYIRAFLT
jgi:hypothetical protein